MVFAQSPDLPGNMPFFFISMDSINLLGLKFDEGALPVNHKTSFAQSKRIA